MRKLLLTLAVLLSAVGFATHAQETWTPPTSASIDDADKKEVMIQNLKRNKWLYAKAEAETTTGNKNKWNVGDVIASQTDDVSLAVKWILVTAQGTNVPEGVTPVYIYNIDTKRYLLHGPDADKAPIMSDAEADADATNGIWYICSDGDIRRISAKVPTSTTSFTGNSLLCDDESEVTKWNGQLGNDNGWEIIEAKDYIENVTAELTNLIDYLSNVDGLFDSEAVSTATTAIEGADKTNIKTYTDALATIKTDFLKKVNHVNLLISAKAAADPNNKDPEVEQGDKQKITDVYLSIHRNSSLSDVIHTHINPGYNSLWHLKWEDGSTSGIHIYNHYEAANNGAGVGQFGSGAGNHPFIPFYYKVNGREGIMFQNPGGNFLKAQGGSTVGGNANEYSDQTVWTLERAYVPTDVVIKQKLADGTLTDEISVVKGHGQIELVPDFTSDHSDGKTVTTGLRGVIWTVEEGGDNVGLIAGTFAQLDEGDETDFGTDGPQTDTNTSSLNYSVSLMASDTEGDVNNSNTGVQGVADSGHLNCYINGLTTGTATIKAKLPISANQLKAHPEDGQTSGDGQTSTTPTEISASATVEVVDPVFTTGTPVKIGDTDIEATDGVYNLPYSDQDRTIIVPITKNDYTADELALSDGVNIDGDNINIAIAADATGEKTFTITYKAPAESGSEQGGEQGEVTTETEDGETAPVLFTLKVNIAKAPLQSFTATLNESELTYSAQAQDVTVTVTPKPEAYNLKAGTMTATIAAKTTVSDPEGTETQAVETPAPVNLTKAGDDNTWTATIAANTAAGDYTITFSYSEGEDNDATVLATATADLTIKPVEYAVVFTSDSKEVTTLAVKPITEASVSVAFKQGETTVETAPAATASLKKKDDENAEPTTLEISNGTISLGTLAEGSYTLTISATDATNVALTANTLPITVTGKDVYTPVFTLANDATATVEPGKKLEVNVAFTDADKQVVSPTGEITASVEPSDKGVTAAFENGKLTITAPESIEDGEFTVTLAAAETADYKIAPETFAFSVKAPVVVKPVYTPAFTLADDATAATVEAGKSVVVPLTFTDAEGKTISDVAATATVEPATEAVKATYAEGKLTIEATAEAEAKDYKVTLAADAEAAYTIDAETTLTVTVTAAEEPAKEGTINGIEMNDATVAIADGEGSVTISGSYTVAEDGAVAPANAAAPTLSASSVEGVTVTFGEVTIKDGKFSSETTIAVTDKATLPAEVTITATYTPAEGEKVSETMTLTLTAQTEGAAEDLKVSSPDKDTLPDGAVATVDGKTATVGFNTTPAGDTEAVMTIDLPSAAAAGTIFKESDFDISYSEDGIATATIAENGTVTITADENAAIGATTTITIKAMPNNGSNDDQTGDTQAYLANETSNDTDDAILTINVTIYGVEFTKAPSTATLGMDNTVNVTFETNACVPAAKEVAPEESSDETEAAEEEAPAVTLSVDGEGAEVDNKTGVITFTKAGKYTVTAKAGDNYAATTTITVKEAPTVTGIEAVNADAAAGNATVYDLQGRRINRVNAAGIYIVNGVKTLVR